MINLSLAVPKMFRIHNHPQVINPCGARWLWLGFDVWAILRKPPEQKICSPCREVRV